jgi:hypothetical protein
MKRLLPLALALSGCAATLVKTEPTDPKVRTIGFKTGRLLDDGAYRSRFEKSSTKACPSGYDILERTRDPSTLAGLEDRPAADFYWVIRCKARSP